MRERAVKICINIENTLETMDNTNNFVKFHVSCGACGSSDARCINKDGSSYCFSCETYFKAPSDFNLEDLDNI